MPKLNRKPSSAQPDEWDILAAALNRYGVKHVAPGVRIDGPLPTGEDLFSQLVTARSIRLREAVIPLLLTHPELDACARAAIEKLFGEQRDRAMRHYLAAGALQRMWSTRLATDLGPRRPIQPAYLAELGLPPLEEDFGRTTLLALSNQEEGLYGYDAWVGYNSLMDLILAELIDPSWGKMDARSR